jgi:hypothetical protein
MDRALKWLSRTFAIVVVIGHLQVAFAQFSPGDLARAHETLEGMNHCADCHEVGKEISGMKCLACHAEIKRELDLKRGYHFAVSAANCVSCHKEHLGKDAQITVFDRSNFDHAKTGFTLTGKHATKQCNDCHTPKFIKDPNVARKKHKTSLGLDAACVSCHEDRHKGVLGTDCKSCHTTTAWKPASNFDHSKTKFALVGKHHDVECNKCHAEPAVNNQSQASILAAKNFADCTPCHKSPHSAKFSTQTCTSCHVPTGWREVREQQFNHDLTNFRLRGKHALVKCDQCHKPDTKVPGGRVLKLAHDRCTECHSDHHQGEFLARYANNCALCHTEAGYRPSTFTLIRHDVLRFPLRGAHMAVPCARCHNPSSSERSVYHFSNIKCESCHKDPHGGQFKNLMGEVGCTRCHSTDEWKTTTFDHSTTSFSLVGKHLTVTCSNCHKPGTKSTIVQYKGASTNCESCHADPHAKQFAASGATSCTTCHTPSGWALLVFDHEKQSSFSLTGAHKKVACRSCHREEQIGSKIILRYKPLSSKCESCHTEKEMKNG